MADQKRTPDWATYLPGQSSDIFALGVIALSYGQLENMFRSLFVVVTGMTESQVITLFNRLNNSSRIDVLLELMDKGTLPSPIKELIRHFAAAFEVCAQDRHELMHSHSNGIFFGHSNQKYPGISLSRFTRTGNKRCCYPTTKSLKAIADDIHEYVLFCSKLIGEIQTFRRLQGENTEKQYYLSPSLDKPSLPNKLRWHAAKPDN